MAHILKVFTILVGTGSCMLGQDQHCDETSLLQVNQMVSPGLKRVDDKWPKKEPFPEVARKRAAAAALEDQGTAIESSSESIARQVPGEVALKSEEEVPRDSKVAKTAMKAAAVTPVALDDADDQDVAEEEGEVQDAAEEEGEVQDAAEEEGEVQDAAEEEVAAKTADKNKNAWWRHYRRRYGKAYRPYPRYRGRHYYRDRMYRHLSNDFDDDLHNDLVTDVDRGYYSRYPYGGDMNRDGIPDVLQTPMMQPQVMPGMMPMGGMMPAGGMGMVGGGYYGGLNRADCYEQCKLLAGFSTRSQCNWQCKRAARMGQSPYGMMGYMSVLQTNAKAKGNAGQ